MIVIFIFHIKNRSTESYCLRLQCKLGGELPPKAKYLLETDSKQVPWGKVAKNSGERVKSTWNRQWERV